MSSLGMRGMREELQNAEEAIRTIETDIVIDYDTFKRRVLPLLSNRGENFNVQQWISLTTHPNLGIHVWDNGELKYTVPALLDNSEFSTGNSEINLSAFANNLDQYSADRPASKDSMLYGVLSAFQTNNSDMIVSSIDAIINLNKIYKDHNMDLIEVDPLMIESYEKVTGKAPNLEYIVVNTPTVKSEEVKSTASAEDIYDDGFELP